MFDFQIGTLNLRIVHVYSRSKLIFGKWMRFENKYGKQNVNSLPLCALQ